MEANLMPLKGSREARRYVLHEDGRVADSYGAIATPPPGQQLYLSRARCRFRLFRAPAGLSHQQLTRAARTYAQAHAPFENSGSLLLRTPQGAEIWYWDCSQLPAAMQAKVAGPESLGWAPGEGWRVVECVEGFEAQYWEQGGLVASTWRRNPFTQEQWAAFALGVDAGTGAPNVAPPALKAAMADWASWRKRLIKAPLSWRDAEIASLTTSLCALALAFFFVGQATHDAARADANTQAIAALEQRIEADTRLVRVRERLDLLRAFNAASHDADVLGVAADALTVFNQFGLDVSAWQSEEGAFRASINGSMSELPLREIVAALEATPRLCGVEPNLSSEAGIVEIVAAIETPGAVCANAGREGRT